MSDFSSGDKILAAALDVVNYTWDENDVCINASRQEIKSSKKSRAYIDIAEKEGKWFSNYGYMMNGGSSQGRGGPVRLDSFSYPDSESAKSEAWKDCERSLQGVDHPDRDNLIETVHGMIKDPVKEIKRDKNDDNIQLELF